METITLLLDVDGVLNTPMKNSFKNFHQAVDQKKITKLVNSRFNFKTIVISSWREFTDIGEIEEAMDPLNVMGCLSDGAKPIELNQWIQDNKEVEYIIIDDDLKGNRVISPSSIVGLQESDISKIKSKLSERKAANIDYSDSL